MHKVSLGCGKLIHLWKRKYLGTKNINMILFSPYAVILILDTWVVWKLPQVSLCIVVKISENASHSKLQHINKYKRGDYSITPGLGKVFLLFLWNNPGFINPGSKLQTLFVSPGLWEKREISKWMLVLVVNYEQLLNRWGELIKLYLVCHIE